MRRTILLFTYLFAFAAIGYAQLDTLKYRISLADKLTSEYSIDRPDEFLSQKAIDRRQKQGLLINETDLPVCKSYVQEIQAQGAKVVVLGKWDNFVTVSFNDPVVLENINKLPFVTKTELVWTASEVDKKSKVAQRDSLVNEMEWFDNYYGAGLEQIQLSHADKLHKEGFKGEGLVLAVIDAGYHNMDVIKGMDNISVLGIRDFVDDNSDIYAENSHGMAVLSCIAMNKPHHMVGTAPHASFWLLRSEDDKSEYPIEEDYWSAAVEYADSVGVDIISTSLGYHEFDDTSKNYRYRDLDGKTALMSRQASKIASKGMVLVCSAGNSGMGSWKKTTTPGDAENIITVGAVNKKGVLAPFSSIGNTADNRIKPDVVAVGLGSDVMGTDGCLSKASGTSFSTPIMAGMVACLWQACPELTALQVVELVRSVGDRFDYPDNIYGYGIPNLWDAYLKVKEIKTNE